MKDGKTSRVYLVSLHSISKQLDAVGSVCRYLPERWLNSLGQLYMFSTTLPTLYMFYTTLPALYKRKMALPQHLSWLEKRHPGDPEQANRGLGKAVPASFSCSLPPTEPDVQRLLSYMDNLWKYGEKRTSGA